MRIPTVAEKLQRQPKAERRYVWGLVPGGLGPRRGTGPKARAPSLCNLGRSPHNAEHALDREAAVPVPQSSGERRKFRMWKGIAVWYADVMAKGGPRRGVALIALTFAGEPGSDGYRNKLRQFWDAYRKAFGNREYFAWAELQERGVIHYHALVVDAPRPEDGHTADRLRHMWGVGRVNVQWRSAGWFAEEATGYAGSYAKKLGSKSYQQNYGGVGEDGLPLVPRTLRTFACSRITTSSGRVTRTPGWVKLMARAEGCHIIDAKKRPKWRGWLLRMSDETTGECFTTRRSIGTVAVRGPTGRPVAMILGPVFSHWDSRRVTPKWGKTLRQPSRQLGPVRMPGASVSIRPCLAE